MVVIEQIDDSVAGGDGCNNEGEGNTDGTLLSSSFCLSSAVVCCCGVSGLLSFADVVCCCSALSLMGVYKCGT